MSVTHELVSYYNEELPLEMNGINYYIDVSAIAQCTEYSGSWEEPPSTNIEVTDVEATWFIKDNKGNLIEVKPTEQMEFYLHDYLECEADWDAYNDDVGYEYHY